MSLMRIWCVSSLKVLVAWLPALMGVLSFGREFSGTCVKAGSPPLMRIRCS